MKTKRRILVVEDDAGIRQGIVDALGLSGFACEQAADGEAGLDLAITYDCELILLDLILPGADGLEILREVRATRPTLPVIILTARGEEGDRVAGLRLGADDYVVKPFSLAELLARVEAVLRRSAERPSDVRRVDIPAGVVDLQARKVRYDDGGECELTERECELLRYLSCNANRPVSRNEILSRVWRMDSAGIRTRTIDMTVARLRGKLRDDPERPLLVTVRGKGYMFAAREGDR